MAPVERPPKAPSSPHVSPTDVPAVVTTRVASGAGLSESQRVARAATQAVAGPEASGAGTTGTLLPSASRGKQSGEFHRVVDSSQGLQAKSNNGRDRAPDDGAELSSLLSRAEAWLERLPQAHGSYRLLSLALMRRDPALLTGLLHMLERGTSR